MIRSSIVNGYHYTSIENYKRIQEVGLIPYQISKPDLQPFFPSGICGVWIWASDLTRETQVGSILWQLMTKASTTVVKLRVKYESEDLLRRFGSLVEVDHDGRLGSWIYHQRETAIIVTRTIPPENITLIKTYDLVSMIG